MSAAIRRWWFQLMGEHGAGMVEYALLVAFIGIALIAAVTALGTDAIKDLGITNFADYVLQLPSVTAGGSGNTWQSSGLIFPGDLPPMGTTSVSLPLDSIPSDPPVASQLPS